MKPLSICYLTGQLGLGGAERQLFLTARELKRRGHSVAVVSFHAGRGDYWEEPLRDAGIPLLTIPYETSRASRLRLVRQHLRRMSASVVHSWAMSANLYAAIAGVFAGTPARLGSERSNHVCSMQDLGKFWYRASLAGLNGLTTNSRFAAEHLSQVKPGLRVWVVPNGVEIPASREMDLEQKEAIRARFGLSSRAFIIACVGSHFRSKNFGQILQAASPLSGRYDQLRILFLGDGPLRGELEQQAAALLPSGRAIFAGAVPGAARLMGAFDVVCLPAIGYEGLPNVLIEAGIAGIPAIASKVGGSPEIVSHGETGFIFEEQDTRGLTACLQKLLADPGLGPRMGAAARHRMETNFSLARMADRMEEAYKESLNSPLAQN